jgi:sugar phosphate isomerase/epimerase
MNSTSRRNFLRQLGIYSASLGLAPAVLAACNQSGNNQNASNGDSTHLASLTDVDKDLFFKISLAEWSFHKSIFNGQLNHLDFAATAKEKFGLSGVEYVNTFFKDKATDKSYLADMKKRADDVGVTSVLIMCDGEGDLGDADEAKRKQAVENHYKWVEAAQFLGCHSIRVNAAGNGTAEEVAKAAADGLSRLTDFAKDFNIGVIVENHGSYSSDGSWLAGVMRAVNKPGCGTLPDFGNFCIKRSQPTENTVEAWLATTCEQDYDKYKGVQELMPFAKGVSAKTHNFDDQGNETDIDYLKMLQLVKDAGYKGYIGIEYEGSTLNEEEGIAKTIALLKRAGAQIR